MDVHDVSRVPRYMDLLRQQKEALQNAQAHEGESPGEASREELIMALLANSLKNLQMQNQTVDGMKVQVIFLPPPYPPSTTPLSGLSKVMIKDLVLETHHRGTYAILRNITPAIRLSAILSVVEDENDDVVVLQLYYQDNSRPPEHILEDQGIVIVKEPYLKRDADGRVSIRVDHVSDVIFLHKFDEKVPEAWRLSASEHDLCQHQHEHCEDERCVNTWRMRGQYFYRQVKDQFAIDCYSKAFQLSPNEFQTRSLCFIRALAYLRMNNFKAALDDLEHPIVTFQPDGTSLFHKARALYGLGRYRECCDIYKTIIQEFPVMVPVDDALAAAIRRVAEQERGQYKFLEMQSEALRPGPPLLDHATYTSSVCIWETGSRGRGLFTTTAVKAGDLLLCEKAFAYAFLDSRADNGEMSLLVNTVTDVMTMGKQAELLTEVIQKVRKNPELLSVLTNLHHGSYESAGVDKVDGAPVVDTFLIERIVALNAFACPTSARERHHPIHNPAWLSRSGHFSCGIWPITSYINHSCYNNANRGMIGDMMIIRASQDLEPNTEITMWYKPFGAKNPKEYLPRFSHWGFECKCLFCEDIRSTHKDTLAKRKGLTARLHRYLDDQFNANPVQIERLLKAVEETYTKPATEVPHLSVWDPALSLSALYEKRKKPRKAIEWGLKALEALGFVVEGGAVPRTSNAPLVVKKWGMMEDQLVTGWIVLARAYRSVAPELEAAARGYAKLCYRICIGEDETFEDTYGLALV